MSLAHYAGVQFVSYTSSAMEQYFLHRPALQSRDAYCETLTRFDKEVRLWLELVEHMKSTATTYVDTDEAREVFSTLEYSYPCDSGRCHIKTMIEPLAFVLRHPCSFCHERCPIPQESLHAAMMSGDFIAFAANDLVSKFSNPTILVDMGAEVRPDEGLTHFVIRSYMERNVKFDRALLWEAKELGGATILAEVPDEWYHFYQFFNVPVSADFGPAHPYSVVKTIADDNSFVTVKLDIDTPDLENKLVQAIVEQSPEACAIHEFFFEHHVHNHLMHFAWGHNVAGTMEDSFKMFLRMRRLGIRAHSWY